MYNRKQFFDVVRPILFKGSIPPSAVTTLSATMDEAEKRDTDTRFVAYMMGTAMGETGENMHPVREGFKDSDAEARAYVKRKGYKYAVEVNGFVWYGRGLVQCTWEANYIKMGKILGIDLPHDPDLALDPKNAVAMMFEGMLRGTYTGKKLKDFILPDGKYDWTNARRIINRLDRATEIGDYARKFHTGLTTAQVV